MKVVMIGHGGHSKVIHDLIISQEGIEVVGCLDDKYQEVRIEDIFYGPLNYVKHLVEYFSDIKFIIAIGDNKVRKKLVSQLKIPDRYFVTLIHHSAVVSYTSKIGIGTVVMPNAVINADSEIGKHAIINSGAIVEHDCTIGDFTHVSPGAALTGAVELEEGVSIGAGATVIPTIKIGKWAVIGAGATVISSIPPYSTAVGIPAVIKKVTNDGGELLVK